MQGLFKLGMHSARVTCRIPIAMHFVDARFCCVCWVSPQSFVIVVTQVGGDAKLTKL